MSRFIPGLAASSEWTAASPAGVNWRFRVPDGVRVEFVDRRMGKQTFVAGREFGDFLVWRRDDVPAYQLAVVVDDAAMQISEVVRGEDLLRSTARQILLQRALGLPTPEYYHCALMTDGDGCASPSAMMRSACARCVPGDRTPKAYGRWLPFATNIEKKSDPNHRIPVRDPLG